MRSCRISACVLATVCAGVVTAAVPARADRLPPGVVPEPLRPRLRRRSRARERFDGTETIRVQVAEPTRTVVLHALEIEFRDVTIGAGAAAQTATVTLDEAQQTATLTVPKPLPAGADRDPHHATAAS